MLRKSILGAQKAIAHRSKKIKKMPIMSIVMRLPTKTKKILISITLLPLINFGPKRLKSVKKVSKETIQVLGSMPPK